VSSHAERTRRYRERKEKCSEGDHSLCGPRTKCPVKGSASGPVTPAGDVTSDVTSPSSDRVTSVPPPAGLGERGQRLWAEWSTAGWAPGHLVMLEEACRTADTLERLHSMAAADKADWLELAPNEAESTEDVVELRVVVNPLLVEIRQQQGGFRQQVAELRYGAGRSPAGSYQPPGATEPAAPETPAVAAPSEEGIGDLIDATGRFTAEG
jgi:hypothetical protein